MVEPLAGIFTAQTRRHFALHPAGYLRFTEGLPQYQFANQPLIELTAGLEVNPSDLTSRENLSMTNRSCLPHVANNPDGHQSVAAYKKRANIESVHVVLHMDALTSLC